MEIINMEENVVQVGGKGACTVVCVGSCLITAVASAMGLAITAL